MAAGSWRAWAADRFGWNPIRTHALERRVARSPWYYGDGATLMLLLGVLVVTGATMTLAYSPTPDAAYQSVQHITHRQVLGWFVRAVHYWSAGFMVIMLFAHLFRQLLVGGYKFPREGTWLIGVAMFFLVLLMSFTGYVLRWDERGITALRVALHMLHNVPLIGDWLVIAVQGGTEPGAKTLTRVYSVHVILVPVTLAGLVGWHLYLVILHGVTSPIERKRPIHTAEQQREVYEKQAESEQLGETFHPETTAKSGAMGVVILAVVVLLALVVGPAALQGPASLTDRAFPSEEWWYWWYSGLIALLPAALAPAVVVLLPIAALVFLVLLPLVDRGPRRGMRERPIAVAMVIAAILGLLYLSDLRRRSPWTAWPLDEPPAIPQGIELSPDAERGREVFARYGCMTCHAVAGHGWAVGPDFAALPQLRSRAEMRQFILHPPTDIAMPSYEGRISGEDLDRLLDFIHAAQAFPLE